MWPKPSGGYSASLLSDIFLPAGLFRRRMSACTGQLCRAATTLDRLCWTLDVTWLLSTFMVTHRFMSLPERTTWSVWRECVQSGYKLPILSEFRGLWINALHLQIVSVSWSWCQSEEQGGRDGSGLLCVWFSGVDGPPHQQEADWCKERQGLSGGRTSQQVYGDPCLCACWLLVMW